MRGSIWGVEDHDLRSLVVRDRWFKSRVPEFPLGLLIVGMRVEDSFGGDI